MGHAFEAGESGDAGDEQPTSGFDEADEGLEADGFEEGDAYDESMGDEAEGLDSLADELEGDSPGAMADDVDALDDDTDLDALDAGGDDADAAWALFEDDVADALDADGTDEFLGALLGGISRAAGAVARGAGPAARLARRAGGVARGVGSVATGAGQLANSASSLARWLGAPGAARSLRRFGAAARGVGSAAGAAGSALGGAASVPRRARQVRDVAGRAAGSPDPLTALLSSIGRLSAEGASDFEAFDAMADLAEDGIDEALPAAVGLAARAAASALGRQGLGQLTQAARRALVRGVATAARTLVAQGGPAAVRALPRIAQSATRVARQRRVPPPQVPRVVSRTVQRTARRVARQPRATRQLSRPMAQPAPLARPTDVGRGVPSISSGDVRRFRINGPVELIIRAR